MDDGGIRIEVSGEIRAAHAELRELIHQGFRGIDPSGVEVRIERTSRSWESFTGRAYAEPPRRPRCHPATRYLIRLKVPGTLRNRGYPKTYRYPRLKTAPAISVIDWRERLVALVAHEAFHIRQFREGLRRSEVAAERWAASVLRDWHAAGRSLQPASRIAPALASGSTAWGGRLRDEDRAAAAASRWEQLSLLQ